MINAAQTTFQSVSIFEGLIYTFWYTKMTHLLLQQIKKKKRNSKTKKVKCDFYSASHPSQTEQNIKKKPRKSTYNFPKLFELWRSWLIDWSIEVSQPEAEAAVMAYASHLIKHSKKVLFLSDLFIIICLMFHVLYF